MLGRFIMAAAAHTRHLGSFKSISLLKVPRDVISQAHCLRDHPLCWVSSDEISISKTWRGISLLGSTQWKEGGGCYFLLLLLLFLGLLSQRNALWLSEVSQCECFLSWVISVLPFWNGISGFSSPYEIIIARQALETGLWEKLTPLFSLFLYIL